jgi:hypothetical protein
MKQRTLDNAIVRPPGKRGFHAARWKGLLAALPVCIAVLLALLPAFNCRAQTSSTQARIAVLPQSMGQRVGDFGDPSGTPSPENERLLRALNADRQKSLVSDTNKLLRLVNELNAEIARANTDHLTPDQLRRVSEIEKLAHNVKEKMSTSVRGTPAFRVPFQPAHF